MPFVLRFCTGKYSRNVFSHPRLNTSGNQAQADEACPLEIAPLSILAAICGSHRNGPDQWLLSSTDIIQSMPVRRISRVRKCLCKSNIVSFHKPFSPIMAVHCVNSLLTRVCFLNTEWMQVSRSCLWRLIRLCSHVSLRQEIPPWHKSEADEGGV